MTRTHLLPPRRTHQTETSGTRSARAEPPGARPTWVEVDLDAIAANTAALKARAAGAQLMGAVKADGYGHGMLPAARAVLAGGADWLAVALVEEGEELRAAGIDADVMVLTEPPAASAGRLLDADLVAAVYTPDFIAALERAAGERGVTVRVHLKLDTGMRRVGVPEADWEDALRAVRRAAHLRLEGLWSHFARADEPDDPSVASQIAAFERGLALARRLGCPPQLAHLCNSAGTVALPHAHYDLVRPGIALYGLEPGPRHDTPLRPALAWYARLALVKRLAAGDAVSYGLTWRAERDVTLGTVPAGYADGVTRTLGNLGSVVVGGHRRPIVGRVCMDQFLVDGGQLDLRAGDEVCLIGRQGDAEVTADDWARWLETINYEVVATIGRRVPRVHVGSAGVSDSASCPEGRSDGAG